MTPQADPLDLVIARQALAIELELVAARLQLSFFVPGAGRCLPQLGVDEYPSEVPIRVISAAPEGAQQESPRSPLRVPDGAAVGFSAAPERACHGSSSVDARKGAAVPIKHL